MTRLRIHAAAVIFFAYLGFEAVSTAGAESRNPGKDMPIGILGALTICTILYILTCAVLVGIVPYADLDVPAPIALAADEGLHQRRFAHPGLAADKDGFAPTQGRPGQCLFQQAQRRAVPPAGNRPRTGTGQRSRRAGTWRTVMAAV